MSRCPASISMYTDHRSQRLGCESMIPSNIVFPRSGSPSLYSSCANFEIVFKSEAWMSGKQCKVAIKAKAHACAFRDSAGREEEVSWLLRHLPYEDNVLRTGSTLSSSYQTFCKSACTVLQPSARNHCVRNTMQRK